MDHSEFFSNMIHPSTPSSGLGSTPNLVQSNCTNKRQRSLDTDSDDDVQIQNSQTFPKFIIIRNSNCEDEKITNLSPFVIDKVIEGLIGTAKNVKKLKDNSLLVETSRKSQTEQLLRQTKFYNINVKVTPHQTLNSSKGIIRDSAMKGVSTDEIKEYLKSQGVLNVRRISIKKEGQIIDTNTFVVTFNTPTLPKQVKIFYRLIKVELYIPNPLRCFECQRFGHHEDRCTAAPVCAKCGKEGFCGVRSENCKGPINCVNCGKDHPAYSNKCEVWLKEKEIMKLKLKNNIPYPEARNFYENTINPSIPSYSSIIKSNQKTVELKDAQTQTCEVSVLKPLEKLKPIDKKTTPKQSPSTTASSSSVKNNNPVKTTSPNKAKPKSSNNKQQVQTDTRQKITDRAYATRGAKESLKLQNKYNGLEDENMELSVEVPHPSTSMSNDNPNSSSSSNLGRRSPVLPP